MRLRRTGGALLTTLLLGGTMVGCDHGEDITGPGDQSLFSQIQEEIFTPSCATSGCHIGGSSFGGLDLSTEDQTYENSVNVPAVEAPDLMRIDPGNPDDSYLLIKIEGGDRLIGQRMPVGRPPLPAEQIQMVRDWIADGAPRD